MINKKAMLTQEAAERILNGLLALDKFHKTPQDVAMWHRKYKELFEALFAEQEAKDNGSAE